jgi:Spy/CpxP family protein refolding chaperone
MAWGSVASALALSACGSSPEGEAAAAAQAGVVQDPPEVAHMSFVREALSKVTLRPDQQPTIDQLGKDADARHQTIKTARVALRNAIADQVQAGKIDRAALKPQMDALLAAIEQSRPADRAAMVRLHDVLDRNQRNQFVDAVESQFRDRMHAGGRPGMGHARQWAADLNLSDQQRDQIRSAVRLKFEGQHDQLRQQWQQTREQGRQMLESFRQDQFTPDPNVQIFGRDRIAGGVDKMLDFAEAAVPTLTPEQRVTAAQKLRNSDGHF